MTELVSLDFQGKAIAFRESDGYWDGTTMCKMYGKNIADFLRLKSTKEYLDAFYYDVPPDSEQPSPIDVTKGGKSEEQGTWIHPEVALKLAAWLNPTFEVWVYRTIKKLLTQGEVRLKDEIHSLQLALGKSEEEASAIAAELALLEYRTDQLRYENDELSELANWRKANSFTGRDS